MAAGLLRRVATWAHENSWLLWLTLAALVVRLHWNLVVHPLEDYIYSDMRGYVRRADAMFLDPWRKREYHAFFPYGTHYLLFLLKAAFGKTNYVAVSIFYAVVGSGIVGMSYAIARRMSHRRWVAPVVGLVLVFYYPLISLGGYILSEIPFSFCMVASTLFALRMVADGRKRDACMLGVMFALGFTIRPQILMGGALFGLLWLLARKHMPKVRLRLLVIAILPFVAVAAFSSLRLHHHTERWGLISENGRFNQVFGRCHNKAIVALPDRPGRARTRFAPPPLIQINKRKRRNPDSWVQLNPAIGVELRYKGYIGDTEVLDDYIRECFEVTGIRGQLDYTVINVLLLWRYNIMWPDSGKRQWQRHGLDWGVAHVNLFWLPALIALLSVFWPRRLLGLGIVSLQAWAIILVAILYLGGARFRAPYDPFFIVMAIEAYAGVLTLASRGFAWVRNRGKGSQV